MKFSLQNQVIKLSFMFLYGLTSACGIRFFLQPADIYTSGITGFAQIIHTVLKQFTSFPTSLGFWNLVLNIPLFLFSWKLLGKSFTLFSIGSVVIASFFLQILPEVRVTSNPLVATIFGGALTGLGIGICLRKGFSTGGLDILALIIRRKFRRSVGKINLVVNAFIMVIASLLFGLEQGLYSIIAIYISIMVIDRLYLQQQLVTLTVYTKQPDVVIQTLRQYTKRGMTIGEGFKGGYTNEDVTAISVTMTKNEGLFVGKLLIDKDASAFINVQPTDSIFGHFLYES